MVGHLYNRPVVTPTLISKQRSFLQGVVVSDRISTNFIEISGPISNSNTTLYNATLTGNLLLPDLPLVINNSGLQTNNVVANGSANIGGDLFTAGGAYITGGVTVQGPVNFNGAVTLGGQVSTLNTVSVLEDTSYSGNLSVEGPALFNNSVAINGPLDANSGITASDDSSFLSNVVITGSLTVNGTIVGQSFGGGLSTGNSSTIVISQNNIEWNPNTDNSNSGIFSSLSTTYDGGVYIAATDGSVHFRGGTSANVYTVNDQNNTTQFYVYNSNSSSSNVASQVGTYNQVIDDGYGKATFMETISYNFSTLSDRTVKTEIEDLNLGLDFVNRLHPKRYRYDKTGRTAYGVIAQEVLEAQPDFAGVTYDRRLDKYVMDYNSLLPVLINAVQDLQKQVDDLKRHHRHP